MGCRLAKDEQTTMTLPCLNMLVLGQSQVGKTKILSLLKGEQSQQHNTLQINSITLNKTLKLLTFQVSGKAQKTWKNYYKCCDIVMIVLDVSLNSEENVKSVRQKLMQIDNGINEKGMIFIVLNKVDLLVQANRNYENETTKYHQNKKQSIMSSCNKFQESPIISKQIDNFVKQLELTSLRHEISYCQCSSESEIMVKNLSKKLFEFVFLGKIKKQNNNNKKIENSNNCK